MRPAGLLQRRPLLLAAAASTGVITGHILDARGLLPGVHEPAAVRAAALAPSYTLLTVLGAAVVAVVAEQVLRRRHPWLAVATLVAGQTALLWMPEALAEAATPRTGGGGDTAELTKLAVAVGLQVVLAALTVLVAVVVDTVLLRLPRTLDVVRLPDPHRAAVVVAAVLTGRIVGGVRGRGPPVPVIP